ncbi:hypothetical protein ACFXOS_19325 [Streptomyces sp. NPDC059175]|uniref:hypothetical protein n=1 Tax=Streptomyces sp. NPDC059175 TaxID=3346757 RepID=UPI0036CBCE3A
MTSAGDATGDGRPDLLATSGSALWALNGYTGAGHGTSGWHTADIPIVIGSPDVSGDGVPDVWAVRANGNATVYPGSRSTTLNTTVICNVISSSVGTTWAGHTAVG